MPFLVAKFKHKHEYGELNAVWRKFFPGPTLSLGKQIWAVGMGERKGYARVQEGVTESSQSPQVASTSSATTHSAQETGQLRNVSERN